MSAELFECDFCHSLSAVKSPERLVFHNVAVDCFEMNCRSCKAKWLPQKEEARIDLEIKNKLADQLTAAQAEIARFQSALDVAVEGLTHYAGFHHIREFESDQCVILEPEDAHPENNRAWLELDKIKLIRGGK